MTLEYEYRQRQKTIFLTAQHYLYVEKYQIKSLIKD